MLIVFSLSAVQAEGLPTHSKSIIVDTDMNTDDCIAIDYLLQKFPFGIKAISVSGTCITFPADGVRNALDLMAIGWPWDIPVAAGQTAMFNGVYHI